jgi:hypothetical protein
LKLLNGVMGKLLDSVMGKVLDGVMGAKSWVNEWRG